MHKINGSIGNYRRPNLNCSRSRTAANNVVRDNVDVVALASCNLGDCLAESDSVDITIVYESAHNGSLVPPNTVADQLGATEVAEGVSRPANYDLSLTCA